VASLPVTFQNKVNILKELKDMEVAVLYTRVITIMGEVSLL
jgi:hypothetical protein